MRAPLPLIIVRRLAALAATVVIAPTLAYVVFGGLSGTLGESLPEAAWGYVVRTFWHFDFGVSGTFHGSLNEVLAWTFPVDVTMVFGGLLLGMGLGIAGGLLAVARPGTLVSRGLQGLGVFLLCCPPYWLPFMLLILFAPGVAMLVEVPFMSRPNLSRGEPHGFFGWLHLLWVPVLMVALPVAAQILRMTIVCVRDVGEQNFITTARAKGLSERQVLHRHILPFVMAPVTALTAANVALVVTNVTLVEAAWNLPGLYRELRDVASLQDTDTVQALIIQTTVFIVVANTIADFVQSRIDPTVR